MSDTRLVVTSNAVLLSRSWTVSKLLQLPVGNITCPSTTAPNVSAPPALFVTPRGTVLDESKLHPSDTWKFTEGRVLCRLQGCTARGEVLMLWYAVVCCGMLWSTRVAHPESMAAIAPTGAVPQSTLQVEIVMLNACLHQAMYSEQHAGQCQGGRFFPPPCCVNASGACMPA